MGGLSSVCAKLEPTSSKINEILEINVQQKFTPHALLMSIWLHYQEVYELNIYINIYILLITWHVKKLN